MAVQTLRDTGLPYDGRPVDVGAAYLTARHPDFSAIVADWVTRGLARAWTDTLTVIDLEGARGSTSGPMRYAAARGLRSLVDDLAADLPTLVHPHDVEEVAPCSAGPGWTIDGDEVDAVVLAMPVPQAMRLLPLGHPAHHALAPVRFDPVLTVVAAYADRSWPSFDGCFVNDSVVLSFVADDGARRGDGAPVLVAHSSSVFAARHLANPTGALPAMLAALASASGSKEAPVWAGVRRWGLARPGTQLDGPYYLASNLGICGDAWGASSRIETAWLSGDRLGTQLAAQLRATAPDPDPDARERTPEPPGRV